MGDEFPSDPKKALLCMQIIVEQAGIAPGGNNFDCKLRRESNALEDMFLAHIGGMDCLARGLRGAVRLMQEGLQREVITQRYSTWESNALAQKVRDGVASLEEIEAYALATADPLPGSGKQEYLEQLINRYV